MKWNEISDKEMEEYREEENHDIPGIDTDDIPLQKKRRGENMKILGEISLKREDKQRNGVIITVGGKEYFVPSTKANFVPEAGSEVELVIRDSIVEYIRKIDEQQDTAKVEIEQIVANAVDTALVIIKYYKKDMDELKIDVSQLICTIVGIIAIEKNKNQRR